MTVAAAPRLVHERIWPPMVVAGLLFARFAPEAAYARFLCPMKLLTGIPCLTCGGTRAVRALVQLELGTAFEMNPLVTLGALAAVAYVLVALRSLWITRRPWAIEVTPKHRRVAQLCAAIAVVSNWAYLIVAGR